MLRNNLPWSLARLTPYLAPEGGEGGGNPPADPPADPPVDPPEDDPKDPPGGEKKYTDADVDKMINQKFAKWQAEQDKKVAEAEKLAKMNADERAKYAQQQADDAQAKLARYEMAGEARRMLSEKSLSLSDGLLDILVDAEADKTKANIDSFADLFTEAVDAEVEKRLKGKTPPAGKGEKTLTKEEIMNIKDPVLRQETIAKNLELFK